MSTAHRVSSRLLSLLTAGQVSGSNRNQSEAVSLIINQLITLTQSGPNIDTGAVYINNMLDIFQFILSDVSFQGKSTFVQSMKTFAYSLVQEQACPAANTEVATVVYSRPLFNLQALKILPVALANRRFINRQSEDYVQFPSQSINLPLTVSVPPQSAVVVRHYVGLISLCSNRSASPSISLSCSVTRYMACPH